MPLRFIGNWYIDGGIYGFYRIMHDAYGWDLKKLNKELENNPEEVLTIKFPVGFVKIITKSKLEIINSVLINFKEKIPKDFCELIERVKNILTISEKDLKDAIQEYREFKDFIRATDPGIIGIDSNIRRKSNEIKEIVDFLEKNNILGKRDKKLVFKTSLYYGYMRNFFLFQGITYPIAIAYKLYFLIKENVKISEKKKVEINLIEEIDKRINYLLFSKEKFHNYLYNRRGSLDINIVRNISSIFEIASNDIKGAFWIPILSFWEAFHKKGNKYYFIYYPNLEKTIEINEMLEKVEEEKDILQEFISKLPTLFKKEVESSFRMIYILEHEGLGGQQSIKKMRYIPIPWSVSYILKRMLEENILRENVNHIIAVKIRDREKKSYVKYNLLEKLIERKESIWKLVSMFQNEKSLKNCLPILYAEAKLTELSRKSRLFSLNFLKRYRLVADISYSEYRKLSDGKIRRFIDEKRIKKDEIRIAFNKIKEGKKAFIDYILSKINLNEVGSKFGEISNLLFDYIVKKGEEWKDYAMIIAISTFVGGGRDEKGKG